MDSARARGIFLPCNDERPDVLPDQGYDRSIGTERRREMTMTPLARTLTATQQNDARSFATYMQGRPTPVDMVERALLRLDWLVRRLRARA